MTSAVPLAPPAVVGAACFWATLLNLAVSNALTDNGVPALVTTTVQLVGVGLAALLAYTQLCHRDLTLRHVGQDTHGVGLMWAGTCDSTNLGWWDDPLIGAITANLSVGDTHHIVVDAPSYIPPGFCIHVTPQCDGAPYEICVGGASPPPAPEQSVLTGSTSKLLSRVQLCQTPSWEARTRHRHPRRFRSMIQPVDAWRYREEGRPESSTSGIVAPGPMT